MLVTSKAILEASLQGYKAGKPFAIGAYNVNNMEQTQGIMRAARETKTPVILQMSKGALKYSEDKYLPSIIRAAVELNPDIPVAMHLDHGNSLETIKRAIDLGFTSVMIDGSLMEDSKTPSTFEYNVKVTSEVVKYAHDHGVSVEGELGTLGGFEDGVGSGKEHLTDPEEAAEFVEKTGVDSLAISIGTSHGAHKFKGEAKIAFDIIEKTRKLLPNTYLVAHGSSSVPKELVDAINQYGGQMEQTAGVPINMLLQATQYGINKINVDTDLRLAATAAVRKYLKENPSKFDQRDWAGAARDGVYNEVIEHMKGFLTAGHAQDVSNWDLEYMQEQYKK